MRFYMIDRIVEWKPGESARGVKNVAFSEDFFGDHFPRHPVMPGVLVVEALAQLSGLLLEATVERDFGKKVKALLSIVERAKFRSASRPGDTLTLDVRLLSVNEDSGKAKGVATADGRSVAEAEMIFAWVLLTDPVLEEKRRKLLEFWLRSAP